jgi:PEGA domain
MQGTLRCAPRLIISSISVFLCGAVSASVVVGAVPRVVRLAGQGPGQAATAKLKLEDGTPVRLRIQRTISSADAQVDDRVDFEVLEEIKVNDVVVVPKGSVALGTVTRAKPKGRMGRGGKLDVNIDSVRLADGEKAALRGVKNMSGAGKGGAMTAGIVATSLIIWPAAPFFLFMHGKDITIPKGTEITVYINGDMELDPAKFGVQPAAHTAPAAATTVPSQPTAEPAVPASVASENLATVVIRSTPDGADITVDGKYAGNAPSTLRLAPGDHNIFVEKSGYKSWQRTVTLGPGGIITIDATLEKP